ncbi:MAG: hypothetical protein JXB29_08035 [Sedimentisphaerales bacterium]|nr:hypothetical protein [Sedimentisphaerales bacterium]
MASHKPSNLKAEAITDDRRQRGFDIFCIFALFGFGVYLSILYFGHQPVPHFDFPCFEKVGHNILSFEMPYSFKRVPLVGVLQILLGKLTGAESPDFVGGWLLNSLLFSFVPVLFWLVGRRIIGKAALWLAVILALNPFMIQLLTEAIVEITLLFCVLATFFLIFRRSRWSYVLASAATMVRYEAALLIFVAFVMDMIYDKNKKERIWSFFYSAIASVPLALWMLGTVMSWRTEGYTHYLKEAGSAGAMSDVFFKYVQLLWQVGFFPFFMPTSEKFKILFVISKIFALAGFVFGLVYGLYKRKWQILALVLFFVPYIFIHVIHSFVLHRFCVIVFWIPIIICFYGLWSFWKLIDAGHRVPRPVVIALQMAVLIISICWLAMIMPVTEKLIPVSKNSASVLYVAIGLICLILLVRAVIYRSRHLWPDIVISVLMALIIASNQVVLAQVVGNGERDIEFKYLLDWYLANAKTGEKLACTAPVILDIMAPKYEDYFVHTRDIKGDNKNEFLQGCYEQNVTYIAWDSRIGRSVNSRYYKSWKVANFAFLSKAQSIGPYEFICTLGTKYRFINVYRLHRISTQPKSKGRETIKK